MNSEQYQHYRASVLANKLRISVDEARKLKRGEITEPEPEPVQPGESSTESEVDNGE